MKIFGFVSVCLLTVAGAAKADPGSGVTHAYELGNNSCVSFTVEGDWIHAVSGNSGCDVVGEHIYRHNGAFVSAQFAVTRGCAGVAVGHTAAPLVAQTQWYCSGTQVATALTQDPLFNGEYEGIVRMNPYSEAYVHYISQGDYVNAPH